MALNDTLTNQFLICRSDSRLCALSLENVVETMRSLPIEFLPSAPDFVLGASIVRSQVLPVVHASALLGAQRQSGHPIHARFVTLRLGKDSNHERHIALAVDSVIGVRRLEPETAGEIVPLLSGASAKAIEAVTMLDAELLLVLQAARLIPDDVWQQLDDRLQKVTS